MEFNWVGPYFSSSQYGAVIGVFLPYSHQVIESSSSHSLQLPSDVWFGFRLIKVVSFSFLFQVSALDAQGTVVEGPVPITIEVKDINDNRPTFLQKKYEGSVRQNSRPGKRREAGDTYGKTIRRKGRICGAHSGSSLIKHFLSYLNFTAALWELFYCPHCSVTCFLSFGTTDTLGPITLSLSGCPEHCRVLAASLQPLPPSCNKKDAFRHCQMSPGGRNHPSWELWF